MLASVFGVQSTVPEQGFSGRDVRARGPQLRLLRGADVAAQVLPQPPHRPAGRGFVRGPALPVHVRLRRAVGTLRGLSSYQACTTDTPPPPPRNRVRV